MIPKYTFNGVNKMKVSGGKNTIQTRQTECILFENLLHNLHCAKGTGDLLYLYGISGVGKSFLLDQFKWIAEEHTIRFVLLDGKSMMFSERLFIEKIGPLLGMEDNKTHINLIDTLQEASKQLNQISKKHPIVFAIDSYEYLEDFDTEIREFLLGNLNNNILVVISSSKRLPAYWILTLHSRRLKLIELKSLSYSEVKDLLSPYNLSKHEVMTIWNLTKGHALSLALAITLIESGSAESLQSVKNSVVLEMGKHWYRGIQDAKLEHLVSVSSLLFQFNQEVLEYVSQEPISTDLFHKLTTLSFYRPSVRGWYIHELVRDTIKSDFERRFPTKFKEYIKRCAFYYYNVLKLEFGKQNMNMIEDFYHFFYYTGSEMLQDVYYMGKIKSSNYFEPMDVTMIKEVKAYIEKRKQTVTIPEELLKLDGIDVDNYLNIVRNDLESLHLEELLDLPSNPVRVYRNSERMIIGLAIILPINQNLCYLLKQPVTGPYIQSLSKKEFTKFKSTNETTGWYIRLIDTIVTMDDATVRADILRCTLSYLGPNRVLVSSTAFPGLGNVFEQIGFSRTTIPVHYDFGKNCPAPTYSLDLRNDHFYTFLKNKMLEAGFPLPVIHNYSLTTREHEVAELVLSCKSNEMIARELYISVVTVKKHIGSIFKKTKVKNRAEFIRLMMNEM